MSRSEGNTKRRNRAKIRLVLGGKGALGAAAPSIWAPQVDEGSTIVAHQCPPQQCNLVVAVGLSCPLPLPLPLGLLLAPLHVLNRLELPALTDEPLPARASEPL